MDLHTVETGGLGIFGTDAVGLDDVGDLFGFQGARHRIVTQRTQQADVAPGGDGAGGHRGFAVQVARVGNAAHVPQLQDDLAAVGVHRLGDIAPALHLLVGPDAGAVRIADAQGRDRGGFADDQPGGRALGVVLGHQRVGHTAFVRAAAGQGSHDDAVGEFQVADLDRVEERGHVVYLGSVESRRHLGIAVAEGGKSRVAGGAAVTARRSSGEEIPR
ncbi:hypothetical protein D9M71_248980 [compost metagenome]